MNELLAEATGESLNADYFLNYIKQHYLAK
jgi:Zn-dependent M32 family carboxypeptidase